MTVVGLVVIGIAAGRRGWFIQDANLDSDIAVVNARNGIRDTFLKVSAGAGAAFAGMLAWGRLQLAHQQHIRDADAAAGIERGRITDRYTKAVEQLGSKDVAVRLGALYALEALAWDSEGHRQTIADVVCAFARHHSLRRDLETGDPILAPDPDDPSNDRWVPTDGRSADYQAAITIALRLPTEWNLSTLDLSGVVILNFDVAQLRRGEGDTSIGPVDLSWATFRGSAKFQRALFRGRADFSHVSFEERTLFGGAMFGGEADFTAANFGDAVFANVTFAKLATFAGAVFRRESTFWRSRFKSDAEFMRTTFRKMPKFAEAVCEESASFDRARLASGIDVAGATFAREPSWPEDLDTPAGYTVRSSVADADKP